MSVRSVFPPAEVFQSATPADRTSRRSSSVVRACAACACVLAGAARRACAARACVRALPKRFPVARGDSARKLVAGFMGRFWPQVLCRGVGNGLLRPLSLRKRCPLHWADGPAFTGGWLYPKRELRTSRTTGDHGRRAPVRRPTSSRCTDGDATTAPTPRVSKSPFLESISSFWKCAILPVFVALSTSHRCKSCMGFLF